MRASHRILYFAYGSNLDPGRATNRGLDVSTASRASLGEHRLAFNKRAADGGVYGNIVRDPTETTWGAVYLCDEAQMRRLDRYEGAPDHYRRTSVSVTLNDGSQTGAVAYVACEKYLCPEGRPSEEYLRLIVNGARTFNLPESYVQRVLSLAGG